MEFGKEMVQETEKSEQLKEICNIVSETLKTQHEITINSEELISCIKKHNERNGYTFGQVCEATKTVNILGTEYKIETHKVSEDDILKDNKWSGYCGEEAKIIVVADMSEKRFFPNMSEKEQEIYRKRTLRHEIIHAFLNESGMSDCSSFSEHWAKDEEMIDWIAIQSPKIFKVFQELDIL